MKRLKRHCLALDLIDDSKLIQEYKKYHQNVWPEITDSLIEAGIENVEIFCIGNRLFMILEVNESFSFDKKAKIDGSNPKVQEWEHLMWKYQKALPKAKEGQKWLIMEKIYQLKETK